ncbi:MAG: hypothetical protein QXD64_08930 [Thermoplasmata archaeon]
MSIENKYCRNNFSFERNEPTWLNGKQGTQNNQIAHYFIFTHAPIVYENGTGCILHYRAEIINLINANGKVEAVFSGHTHEAKQYTKYVEYDSYEVPGYPITPDTMNIPDTFYEDIVPFTWATVYIVTKNSTR